MNMSAYRVPYSVTSSWSPFMPKTLPASFADRFARFVNSDVEALPMAYDRYAAKVGRNKSWQKESLPLPPLMRIDGSPKPDTIPNLPLNSDEIESTKERGFISDWKLLNSMFDHRVYSRGWIPGRGCGEATPIDEFTDNTARQVLYDHWGSGGLGVYYEFYKYKGGGRGNVRWETYKLDEVSDDEKLYSEAVRGLFAAALVIGLNKKRGFFFEEDPNAVIERHIMHSVKALLMMERPAASAMVLDMLSRRYRHDGPRNRHFRLAAADMWLESLKTDHDPRTFEWRMQRAINGAQHVYGDGTLEGIFRAAIDFYAEVENVDELVKSYARASWARFQKRDAPQRKLRPGEAGPIPRKNQRKRKFRAHDWMQVGQDLRKLGDLFEEHAPNPPVPEGREFMRDIIKLKYEWGIDQARSLAADAEEHARRAVA